MAEQEKKVAKKVTKVVRAKRPATKQPTLRDIDRSIQKLIRRRAQMLRRDAAKQQREQAKLVKMFK